MVTLAVIALGPGAADAAGTATVRGVAAVNVRRGPSPDSPSLLTLRKGASVTVEKVVDGWAIVTLASGQQGYIKAAFLDLPAGIESTSAPAATDTRSPAASATPGIVATFTPPTSEAQTDPNRTELLERELAHMRQRLAAIESAVTTPGSARPTPPEGAVVGQQRRPDEPTHVGGALLPTAAAAPDPGEIGPSLALAGVGALIGFLIGTVYGRRQERNRRSRVRF